jgi:hypothetical protein
MKNNPPNNTKWYQRFYHWVFENLRWDIFSRILFWIFQFVFAFLFPKKADFLGIENKINIILIIFSYYLIILGFWSFINAVLGFIYRIRNKQPIIQSRRYWLVYILYFSLLIGLFLWQSKFISITIDKIKELSSTSVPTLTSTPTSAIIPTNSPSPTTTPTTIPTSTPTPTPSLFVYSVDRYYWYIDKATNRYSLDDAWNLLSFNAQNMPIYRNDIDNFRDIWFGTANKEGFQILYTIYDCTLSGKPRTVDVIFTLFYRRIGASYQSSVPEYINKYQRIYLDSKTKIYSIDDSISGTTDCPLAVNRDKPELIPTELP